MLTAKSSAAPYVPKVHSLPILQAAVEKCRGCELYRNATQAVFGELKGRKTRSSEKATIVMLGEQPGDREDTEGHPFVGPAGKLLDKCLQEAEMDRQDVYITNAVKHFKWEPRGKLRIHKKPSIPEVRACRPWLEAELDAVQPKLIVCLGAVASQALLGAKFRLTQLHGTIQQAERYPPILATMHPAAILRSRTAEDRHRQMATFITDLQHAVQFLASQ
jgi:uracil-DNA glycosylase family protein